MKNISIFQVVVLGLFVLFIMGGIVAVSIYSNSVRGGNPAQQEDVTIWGTLDHAMVTSFIKSVPGLAEQSIRVTYYQIDQSNLIVRLLEAITSGQSPDILLLSSNMFMSIANRISVVSYDNYSARMYKDTFVQESELFLTPAGIVAMPFSIDPMVMYWNRDIFLSVGLNYPPKYWDELYYLAKKMTKRSQDGTISQSALALGGYDNVSHAKDVIANLFLQAGNQITTWRSDYASLNVVLAAQDLSTPSDSVLAFYTQFANPTSPVYSWNNSLPDSKAMFVSNRLGVYFGFASEFTEIKTKNPNLNFDVAIMPQFKDRPTPSVLGNLYGLFLVWPQAHASAATSVLMTLTNVDSMTKWAEISQLPSTRKDVRIQTSNPYLTTFRDSTIIAKGWIDPNDASSDTIFRNMINSVVSGQSTPVSAISNADAQLKQTLSQ